MFLFTGRDMIIKRKLEDEFCQNMYIRLEPNLTSADSPSGFVLFCLALTWPDLTWPVNANDTDLVPRVTWPGLCRFVDPPKSLLRNPGLICCPECYSPHLANNPRVYCSDTPRTPLATYLVVAFIISALEHFYQTFLSSDLLLVIRSQSWLENLLICS